MIALDKFYILKLLFCSKIIR